MGIKNYLINGVSCSGKTSVCDELQRRGYHCIHGDRELAYFGDIKTGQPLDDCTSEERSWLWDVKKVASIVADQNQAITFFCGGCRNLSKFIDLFDDIFILEIDLDTLNQRLAARPEDEWGGTAAEGESYARLQHSTRNGFSNKGISIEATRPISSVVDKILETVIL